MKILFRVGLVLLLGGIVLIATGIVLSGFGKLVSADGALLPNYRAAMCFVIGLPALWLGCAGTAAVLRRGRALLAGLATIAGSFVVPWSLRAIGVTWWTYYSPIPAVAVLVAGCIVLGLAAVRIALSGLFQLGSATSRWRPLAGLRVYLRPVLIGLVLGSLAYLCLANWYQPPTIALASDAEADFEWDPAHGVTAFRLRGSTSGSPFWTSARESLIGFQIKPQLDSFMRLGPVQKLAGIAGMNVVRVIPFAIPHNWGSGGLCIGRSPCL